MMRKLVGALLALGLMGAPAIGADCSGTITTGGTAQTILQSSNVRTVIVMNNSANLMCLSLDSTAAIAGTNCEAGSYVLQPGSATTAGGSFVSPQGFAVSRLSIISSTTGDRFTCTRQ